MRWWTIWMGEWILCSFCTAGTLCRKINMRLEKWLWKKISAEWQKGNTKDMKSQAFISLALSIAHTCTQRCHQHSLNRGGFTKVKQESFLITRKAFSLWDMLLILGGIDAITLRSPLKNPVTAWLKGQYTGLNYTETYKVAELQKHGTKHELVTLLHTQTDSLPCWDLEETCITMFLN